MIRSMTGFGKFSVMFENFDIFVEIKSVNSKYFDVFFKLPKTISSSEITLRNPLQEVLQRGKVEVRVDINAKTAIKIPQINEPIFKYYKNVLQNIIDVGELQDTIKLEHYLRLPDIIEFRTDENAEGVLEQNVLEAVINCAKNLNTMREFEGKKLHDDLSSRLSNLANLLTNIENSRGDIFSYWYEKFKKRMVELNVSDDFEERIVQEAIVFSEKADITEEIVRLKTHFNQFNRTLKNEDQVGKKLDFLCQELNREFNTIASKSMHSEIINSVVEAKTEIDRIREQVQNLI